MKPKLKQGRLLKLLTLHDVSQAQPDVGAGLKMVLKMLQITVWTATTAKSVTVEWGSEKCDSGGLLLWPEGLHLRFEFVRNNTFRLNCSRQNNLVTWNKEERVKRTQQQNTPRKYKHTFFTLAISSRPASKASIAWLGNQSNLNARHDT